MRFTAVMVTWNSAAEIPALMESLDRYLARGCELLFVDNNSSDGTADVIRAASPGSRLIELAENVGFGPACNIGVQAAVTCVVILLNPDSVVIDNSLGGLAEVASRERALFAPLVLNEDGSPQISARPALASCESTLISIWPGAFMPKRLRARCEPWRYAERLPAGWLSGACLAAQRELLLEFGPFDERLVLYGEDGDLCIRAHQAGVPSISAGDVARIVHLGGRSGSQAFSDVGMQRKVEARWWVVHERLGAARGIFDLSLQFIVQASRFVVKRALRRDAEFHSVWLRAARRAVRSRKPPLPSPLPDA